MSEQLKVVDVKDIKYNRESRDKFKKKVKILYVPYFQENDRVVFNFEGVDENDYSLYGLLSSMILTLCYELSVELVRKKLAVKNATELIVHNIETFYDFLEKDYKMK